jgi:cation:H+ antiporter
MTLPVVTMILSLLAVLGAAELFTNGVEWLGKRLNIARGAVGSVLAAVGTALPETLVALVAVLVGTEGSKQIGIGAILGAPFMLSTLAFGVTGVAVLGYRKRRGRGQLTIDRDVMARDLGTFVVLYGLAIGSSFIPWREARLLVVAVLLLSYAGYLVKTFRGPGKIEGDLNPLHLKVVFSRYFARRGKHETDHEFHHRRRQRAHHPPALLPIVVQVAFALAIIVGGARLFVYGAEIVAVALGVPPMIFAIVVAPIMTELPEKFNSVIWVRQGKDTLAMGNITGAMVFQSSLVPSVGIIFTPWHLLASNGHHQPALVSIAVALFSGLVVLALVLRPSRSGSHRTSLHPGVLLALSALYLVWLFFAFFVHF